MTNRLQVGLDFSQKRADLCFLHPNGQLLEPHLGLSNTPAGAEQLKRMALELVAEHQLDGLDISGEATGYYWLPFFLQLAHDAELAQQDVELFLLNPRWVKWFKKCFAQDDKSDQKDPFYIAERTRTRRPTAAFEPQFDTWPLRFYTRYRFHLAQDLSREKTYFAALLFLKHSAYYTTKPFANVFGQTSQLFLSDQIDLAQAAQLSLPELSDLLSHLAHNKLPEPRTTALKLQRVADRSFTLDPALAPAVQTVLNFTLDHIRFIAAQLRQVETHIQAELDHLPAIQQLTTIPGLGLILAAGIGAEIGDTQRFLAGQKWDKRKKRFRPKTLRDAEDAVAKIAGLWWPKHDSGDFQAQERRLAKSGNRYLRYFLIQAADQMRKRIPHYQAFYHKKFHEAAKHHHKRALVLTARKSVGLVVGLLHRNEPFRSQEGP